MPDISKVDVFKDFTDTLMSFQQQLQTTYHTDGQIRDRFLTSIVIQMVQEMISDFQLKRPMIRSRK